MYRSQHTTGALARRIDEIAGDVTLRLSDGTELTGPATVDQSSTGGYIVTITDTAVEWTVDLGHVIAVGGAA